MAKKRSMKKASKSTTQSSVRAGVDLNASILCSDRVLCRISSKQPSSVDRYLNHDVAFEIASNVQTNETATQALERVEVEIIEYFDLHLTEILDELDRTAQERIASRPKR